MKKSAAMLYWVLLKCVAPNLIYYLKRYFCYPERCLYEELLTGIEEWKTTCSLYWSPL